MGWGLTLLVQPNTTMECPPLSDSNEKITAMVERALKKDPDLKSSDLRERAGKIDPAVAELSGRQFHAQYVIQVRKKLFGSTPSKRRRSGRKPRTKNKAQADAASSFLSATLNEKKAELNAAIEEAFQRALRADSVKKVDELLASIEQQTREMERV